MAEKEEEIADKVCKRKGRTCKTRVGKGDSEWGVRNSEKSLEPEEMVSVVEGENDDGVEDGVL